MKPRLFTILIAGSMSCVFAVLSGCGNVAVFGRTIGEKKTASNAEAMASSNTLPIQSTSVQSNATTSSVTSAPAAKAESTKVKSVSVVLGEQVAAKVAQDPTFNSEALLAAIKKELVSRNVLDDSHSTVTAAAEIVVNEYAMNPTSNAIVFGQIISNGVLRGTLRVRDGKDSELSNTPIEAKVRISVPAKGVSENPLAPLYREFAVLTGDALTGLTTPRQDSDAWRPR